MKERERERERVNREGIERRKRNVNEFKRYLRSYLPW